MKEKQEEVIEEKPDNIEGDSSLKMTMYFSNTTSKSIELSKVTEWNLILFISGIYTKRKEIIYRACYTSKKGC